MNNKFIKKFNDFITENYGMNLSSSFGNTDLSHTNSGSEQPVDKDLSFDEYDRHKNNLKDKVNRFVSIGKSVFTTGSFNFGFDFISEIEDLYIVKIYPNNNGTLDIYIRFTLEEDIFYGKFEGWGGIDKAEFKSRILFMPIINGYKDNKYKLIGLFEDALNKWFRPKDSCYYRTLKKVSVYDRIGRIYDIDEGGLVKIEDVIIQDNKPTIYINYNDTVYTLSGLNYFYFNWWFKMEEEKEFYL